MNEHFVGTYDFFTCPSTSRTSAAWSMRSSTSSTAGRWCRSSASTTGGAGTLQLREGVRRRVRAHQGKTSMISRFQNSSLMEKGGSTARSSSRAAARTPTSPSGSRAATDSTTGAVLGGSGYHRVGATATAGSRHGDANGGALMTELGTTQTWHFSPTFRTPFLMDFISFYFPIFFIIARLLSLNCFCCLLLLRKGPSCLRLEAPSRAVRERSSHQTHDYDCAHLTRSHRQPKSASKN